eukprot:8482541-Alexandrium_andersonii.AAC.1
MTDLHPVLVDVGVPHRQAVPSNCLEESAADCKCAPSQDGRVLVLTRRVVQLQGQVQRGHSTLGDISTERTTAIMHTLLTSPG